MPPCQKSKTRGSNFWNWFLCTPCFWWELFWGALFLKEILRVNAVWEGLSSGVAPVLIWFDLVENNHLVVKTLLMNAPVRLRRPISFFFVDENLWYFYHSDFQHGDTHTPSFAAIRAFWRGEPGNVFMKTGKFFPFSTVLALFPSLDHKIKHTIVFPALFSIGTYKESKKKCIFGGFQVWPAVQLGWKSHAVPPPPPLSHYTGVQSTPFFVWTFFLDGNDYPQSFRRIGKHLKERHTITFSKSQKWTVRPNFHCYPYFYQKTNGSIVFLSFFSIDWCKLKNFNSTFKGSERVDRHFFCSKFPRRTPSAPYIFFDSAPFQANFWGNAKYSLFTIPTKFHADQTQFNPRSYPKRWRNAKNHAFSPIFTDFPTCYQKTNNTIVFPVIYSIEMRANIFFCA